MASNPAADGGTGQPDGNRPPTDGPMAIPFKGTMAQTTPVAFGGTFNNIPYCNYTITLRQLEIDLGILTSGQVTTGRVQALNVEATDATCTQPVIPANIASYTLQSATPSGNTIRLVFQGAAGNAPAASLIATLTPSGAAYSAALTFHRTDLGPPFDWIVNATLSVVP